MWHENKNLIGVICVHVDDFSCSGNKFFFIHTIFILHQTFSFGKEENDCFRHLGLNILTDQQGCININQTEYINQLNKINTEPSRKQQWSEWSRYDENKNWSITLGTKSKSTWHKLLCQYFCLKFKIRQSQWFINSQ